MEPFDKMLKELASKEECIVPEGFDKNLQDILCKLPPRAKRRGLRAAKTALIAAAACAALLCTAFAASPGLREMLAAALGSFAPYAQEQEDKVYTMDGFEVKVLSAMADQDTIRIYVQLKDLEGDRLSDRLHGSHFVHIPEPEHASGGIKMSTSYSHCLSYDKETKTALMVFTSWGQAYEDLSGATVDLGFIYDEQQPQNHIMSGTFHIPLDIEVMPSVTLDGDTQLAAGFFAETVRLSPLGLTAVTFGDTQYTYLVGSRLRLHLADGTEILSGREDGGPDGQGSYGEYGTESSRRVLTWNFRDPLEVEQIQSVTIIDRDGGERTFPVELP